MASFNLLRNDCLSVEMNHIENSFFLQFSDCQDSDGLDKIDFFQLNSSPQVKNI